MQFETTQKFNICWFFCQTGIAIIISSIHYEIIQSIRNVYTSMIYNSKTQYTTKTSYKCVR